MLPLEKLLPNSSKKKRQEEITNLMYIPLVEWQWSFRDFKETPIPLLIELMNEWKNRKEKEQQEMNKKHK